MPDGLERRERGAGGSPDAIDRTPGQQRRAARPVGGAPFVELDRRRLAGRIEQQAAELDCRDAVDHAVVHLPH